MKRREFISKGISAAAGSAFMLGLGRRGSAQNKEYLSMIAEERKSHPIYFDGLTFFGEDKEGIRKSGLSGLVWDISAGEMVEGKFIRRMIPSLKSTAKALKLLRDNDQGLFLATKGSQVKEAHKAGRTAVFLQFQSLEPITEDLDIMDVFYEMGIRILQITHHYGNPFAGGCLVKSLPD